MDKLPELLLRESAVRRFAKDHRLSPRETEMALLIARGIESNKELAEAMGVATSTAQRMAHDIYAKTRTSSKFEVFRAMLNHRRPDDKGRMGNLLPMLLFM
jgi:DNA-binding CsgD family transcriptional regulator